MSEQSHFRPLACLYSSLQAHFGQGADSYVAVQTPLHYDEQHPTLCKQPDMMVVKGINNLDRARFCLWEEQRAPAVIFEITSGKRWLEDLVNKSALYMQLGVKEYFIFDPHGEFLKDFVQGLRLVEQNGHPEYVPIPVEKDGMLRSEVLDLKLYTRNHLLRLIDAETQQMIPWAEELKGFTPPLRKADGVVDETNEAVAEANARLQQAEERLRQTEERIRQMEDHAKRNGQEAQRLKTLEAENSHLRVLLGQMQGAKVAR
ncbi:MAG: Uma2 family endonuclease [Caldilineaceae bacterium]